MAKKGTANAFLQYKEDRSLGVRHANTDLLTVSFLLASWEEIEVKKVFLK